MDDALTEKLRVRLSDTNGDYWPDMRPALLEISRGLSLTMSPSNLEKGIRLLEELKIEGVYYHFFGLGVLAHAVRDASVPAFVEEGFNALLEKVLSIEKDNDRLVTLVGNPYWPGYLEALPRTGEESWIEEILFRSFSAIQEIEAEGLRAMGISGLSRAVFQCAHGAVQRRLSFDLLNNAKSITDEGERSNVFAGIAEKLHYIGENAWFDEYSSEVYDACYSLSRESYRGNSPRAHALSSFVRGMGLSRSDIAPDSFVQDYLGKLSFLREEEKALIIGGIASVVIPTKIKNAETEKADEEDIATVVPFERRDAQASALGHILEFIGGLKSDKARGQAIGQLAGHLRWVPSNEIDESLFQQLMALAKTIRNEEAYVNVISDGYDSIAGALFSFGDAQWARSMLSRLVADSDYVKTPQLRGSLLVGIVDALERSSEPSWAQTLCQEVLEAIIRLKDHEARGEALSSLATTFGNLNAIPWATDAVRTILSRSQDIGDSVAKISVLASSTKALLKHCGDTLPNDVIDELLDIANAESEMEYVFALKDIAESIVENSSHLPFVKEALRRILDESRTISDPRMQVEVWNGVLRGSEWSERNEVIQAVWDQALSELISLKDDVELCTHLLTYFSKLDKYIVDNVGASYVADLFSKLIHFSTGISEEPLRFAVLFADQLDLQDVDYRSASDTLSKFEQGDWGAIARKLIKESDSFSLLATRVFSSLQILKHFVVNPVGNEGFTYGAWAPPVYLNRLALVASILNQFRDQVGAEAQEGGASLDEAEECVAQSLQKMFVFFTSAPNDLPDLESHQMGFPEWCERILRKEGEDSDPGDSNVEGPIAELWIAATKLLGAIGGLSEKTHTEEDVIYKEERFSIAPQPAALEMLTCLSVIFSEDKKATILASIVENAKEIKKTENRTAAYQALLQRLKDPSWGEIGATAIVDLVESVSNFPEEFSTLVRPAVEALASVGEITKAFDFAVRIPDSQERLNALQTVADILETSDASLKKQRDRLGGELEVMLQEFVETTVELNRERGSTKIGNYVFDVAISCAGQDAEHADALYKAMKTQGLEVFYFRDSSRMEQVWGEDLYRYFFKIYNSQALYCMVLISKNYVSKKWPLHELTAAQARELDSGEAYILPVRIDDSQVPGMPSTKGYFSLRDLSYNAIAELAARRVAQKKASLI